MPRISLRAQLLAGFAIDLVLLIALGVFAVQQMATMNQRAALIERRTIPALDAVGDMQAVINQYRVRQLEYLIYDNPADQSRGAMRLRELEDQMAAIFAAYEPLVASPAQAERFAEVRAAWEAVVTEYNERFLLVIDPRNTGSVQPSYSRMNPLYSRLDQTMVRLNAETQAQAQAELAVVRSSYQSARSFILADTVLAVVISAAIGLLLSGRVAARIGRLTRATRKVARGDLSPSLERAGNDEIGLLTRNFNQMVDSLREQREALEQRNSALQVSLARQEQLTADLIRGREAEAAAVQARAAAEAASQAKSMFLATMSHELRTPLNAILGYAQLLRLTSAARPDAADQLPQLDRILAAGRHLTAMINNVLDFSKIEHGAIELKLEPCDPAALAREAADVVQPLIDRQGNQLRLAQSADLPALTSDAGKLRQVLINLLGNAAKFTESGTISLRVRRATAGEAPAGVAAAVVFEVEDSGIGIPADQIERLFQPFSQVDSSVTRRYEGSGLGLALSQRICQALGGTISVRSQVGAGSTFSVWLPARPDLAAGPVTPDDAHRYQEDELQPVAVQQLS